MDRSVSTNRTLRCVKLFCFTGISMFFIYIIIIIMTTGRLPSGALCAAGLLVHRIYHPYFCILRLFLCFSTFIPAVFFGMWRILTDETIIWTAGCFPSGPFGAASLLLRIFCARVLARRRLSGVHHKANPHPKLVRKQHQGAPAVPLHRRRHVARCRCDTWR
jgi:hypothetical protein